MHRSFHLISLGLLSVLSLPIVANAKTVKALFIGNSYTASNNLPEMVNQLAISTGDTLIYSSHTPGGYTFEQHCVENSTINLIQQGDWDYVILQEQSQKPSFPDQQVARSVFPYAAQLDSLIQAYNPCAQTVFYMTWGRKNGDQQNCGYFPPLCTYRGMDSLLQLRYTQMAEDNKAVISPVAKLWRAIINQHPSIDLYTGDESHPSEEGTLAAAYTFYTVLFHKDPTTTTYTANVAAANTIKEAAKANVYDSLAHWYRFTTLPNASFDNTINGMDISFNNTSVGYDNFEWDFGDGNYSNAQHPTHTYTNPGTYTVNLICTNTTCNQSENITETFDIGVTSINNITSIKGLSIYPNPSNHSVNIKWNEQGLHNIAIADITGKIIDKWQTQEQGIVLELSNYKTGTYVLHIQNQHGQIATQNIQKL